MAVIFNTLEVPETGLFGAKNWDFSLYLIKKSYICLPKNGVLNMANHQSAIKRIRSNEAKRLENRYYAKTTRSAVKTLRSATSKKEADELLPKVNSMLDKLAKKNVIHKNKAGNIKSKLARKVASLK
jgi:small subunit ribosomal protein S20